LSGIYGSTKKLLLIFFGLFGVSGSAAHAKQPKLTTFECARIYEFVTVDALFVLESARRLSEYKYKNEIEL
jgi:hypothetical protein